MEADVNLDEIKQFIVDNREIAHVQAQRWQGVDPSRMLAALDHLEQVIAAYANTVPVRAQPKPASEEEAKELRRALPVWLDRKRLPDIPTTIERPRTGLSLQDRRKSVRQMIDAHDQACRNHQIAIATTLDGLRALFEGSQYHVEMVHHEDDTRSLVVGTVVYIYHNEVRPAMTVGEYRQWRMALSDMPHIYTYPLYSYGERL